MNKNSILIIFAFIFSLISHASNEPELKILKGAEISPYIIEIADLQRLVFREYPHLYVGPAEEYYEYAAIYNQSSAIACLLFIDSKLVAAITGIKFEDMFSEFKIPFYEHQMDISRMFYLGELVILKEYRGKGYGSQLAQLLEQEVRTTGLYDQICLCTMDESEVADKKPEDAPNKDLFWLRQGFTQIPKVVAVTDWIMEGADETSLHRLNFWIKLLE